jgi:hypothetical protein
MIFLSVILMSLLASLIGAFIKLKIWGQKNKPITPLSYGRAWAAYIAFIVPISSIHLFIRKDLLNAITDFLVSLIVFPALAFLCGYIYGFLKNKSPIRNKIYLLAVTLTIIGCVGFIANKFVLTKDEKWIPIAKIPPIEIKPSVYMGDEIIYVDINSITDNNQHVTLNNGTELKIPDINGARFIKNKIEFDCREKKYRTLSSYKYEKSIDEKFGKLIIATEDVQSLFAKLSVESGAQYSGGWATLEYELLEISTNPRTTGIEKWSYENSKVAIQFIKFICNKEY